jgi:hypothetical protein
MQLFDDKGKPVEVQSEEDINKKIQESVAAATGSLKTEYENKQKDLEAQVTLAKDAADKAAKALADADKGDENFAALRKAKEDAEARAATAVAERETIVKETISGVASQFATRARNEMIQKLSQGDKDLADKLLVNYEKTLNTMPANTDEDVALRMAAAYKLSVDNAKPGLLDSIIGSKPSGAPPSSTTNGKLDPRVAEAGKAFGLSEEEIIKYTEKAKKNYINTSDKS